MPEMKAIKWGAIAILVYMTIVFSFEAMLGLFQPENESTIVISTRDAEGTTESRVVSPVYDGDTLYVSANHWPRSWYNRAREQPEVEVTENGQTRAFIAVPVSGAEDARLQEEYAHPFLFRLLTGFPPRHFLRLEPR